jgi:hypothetical protein
MKLFRLVFFGGMAILCAFWTVVTLSRGEYLTAIVVLGLPVSCVGIGATFVWVDLGKVTARGTFDATGTTIQPDRGLDSLSQIWGLTGVIGMGLFAILAPLGKLDIPISHTMRFYLPFLAVGGAVSGVPILLRSFRRGSTSYVTLTSDGFAFAEYLSTVRGKWDGVKDVTDRQPQGRRPPRRAIVMVMSDGRNSTLLSADSFTPDGQALRELVRFYWQHPQHRRELADGQALTRLSSNEFKAD